MHPSVDISQFVCFIQIWRAFTAANNLQDTVDTGWDKMLPEDALNPLHQRQSVDAPEKDEMWPLDSESKIK